MTLTTPLKELKMSDSQLIANADSNVLKCAFEQGAEDKRKGFSEHPYFDCMSNLIKAWRYGYELARPL